jgi:nitrite reductase/ring-hydroxylating ferredoxin subunit
MAQFVPVLKDSELSDGTMSPVDVNGTRILVSKLEGEVYAVAGVCTHEEQDLATGFVAEERVTCPLHLSQFDLRDGSVLNPPATAPLKRFNVKIEGGTILVEV